MVTWKGSGFRFEGSEKVGFKVEGMLNAIRKHNCFLCSAFYVKGVSLGCVGLN